MIDTYVKGSWMYEKLEFVAKTIELLAHAKDANVRITVEDTYWDFGQDWKWTTLICRRYGAYGSSSYQMLYPHHAESIFFEDDPIGLVNIANDIFEKQKDLIVGGK